MVLESTRSRTPVPPDSGNPLSRHCRELHCICISRNGRRTNSRSDDQGLMAIIDRRPRILRGGARGTDGFAACWHLLESIPAHGWAGGDHFADGKQ